MSDHTPGPWALVWKDGKHGVVAASVENKMVFVGLIGNNDDDPIKNEFRKANAHLISCAPEMYEALKTSRDKEYNAFEPENQSDFYHLLTDLINKIEGKS